MERTISEARALLDRTINDTAKLGKTLSAAKPILQSNAETCDALIARVAGSLLQLRDANWQARQLAVRRIASLSRKRGRVGRRWWRTATRLLWARMKDPESGDFFFVNMASLKTTWDAPLVFGRAYAPEFFRTVFPSTLSKVAAVAAMQRVVRRYLARRKVSAVVVHHWRLVQIRPGDVRKLWPDGKPYLPKRRVPLPKGDPMAGFYYYNLKNLRRAMDRPTILFTRKPEILGEHANDEKMRKGTLKLQAIVRRRFCRKILHDKLADRWERVFDPLYKRFFFFNKKVGSSVWKSPFPDALGNVTVPTAAEFEAIKRRRLEEKAAMIVSKVAYVIFARMKLRKVLEKKTTWVRAYDEEYKRYFYSNTATGESTWTKPPLFKRLQAEPPIAVDEEEADK